MNQNNKPIHVTKVEGLIKLSRGTFMSGTYVKNSGEHRVFNGRIRVKKGVNGNGLRYDIDTKPIMIYWDRKRLNFRSIRLDRLLEIQVRGQRYAVIGMESPSAKTKNI